MGAIEVECRAGQRIDENMGAYKFTNTSGRGQATNPAATLERGWQGYPVAGQPPRLRSDCSGQGSLSARRLVDHASVDAPSRRLSVCTVTANSCGSMGFAMWTW